MFDRNKVGVEGCLKTNEQTKTFKFAICEPSSYQFILGSFDPNEETAC